MLAELGMVNIVPFLVENSKSCKRSKKTLLYDDKVDISRKLKTIQTADNVLREYPLDITVYVRSQPTVSMVLYRN